MIKTIKHLQYIQNEKSKLFKILNEIIYFKMVHNVPCCMWELFK